MNSFSLDTILPVVDDFEGMQLRVRSQLQKKRQAFEEKRLYPHMAELVEMHLSLHMLDKNKDVVFDGLKRKARMTKFDHLMDKVIEREDVKDQLRNNIYEVLGLSEWAIPLIEDTISVGQKIQSDTENGMEIEWVDLISSYLDEGYLIISTVDAEAEKQLRVFSYERKNFISSSNERYSKLETNPESVDSSATDPGQMKRDLLLARSYKRRIFHPNPPVIHIDTMVPYPFNATIFPVAKRKLHKWLHQQENPDNH
ncbi:MAG: hypothetical protein WD335_03445 [Candidatus Paceibacterota bacterium]